MKSLNYLTLITLIFASKGYAQEVKTAAQTQQSKVLSISLRNKKENKSSGYTSYDVFAIIESSNKCEVPNQFIATSSPKGDFKEIIVSGVPNRGTCPALYAPVTTDVLITTVFENENEKLSDYPIFVNGLPVSTVSE